MKYIQIEYTPNRQVGQFFGSPAMYVDLTVITKGKCTNCKEFAKFPKYYISAASGIDTGCFNCKLLSEQIADTIADELMLILKLRTI